MTDARLRDLERAAAADPAAAARLLQERVRAGQLTPARLRLAAYLGAPGARLALGDAAPAAPDDLVDFVAGLGAWGQEAVVRAAMAAARTTLPLYERQHPHDRRPHLCVELAAAWLGSRDPDAAAGARRLVEAIWERPFPQARYAYAPALLLVGLFGGDGDEALEVRDAAEGAAAVAGFAAAEVAAAVVETPRGWRVRLGERPDALIRAVQGVRSRAALGVRHGRQPPPPGAPGRVPRWVERLLARATDRVWADDGLTPERARAAIRDELLAWALASA